MEILRDMTVWVLRSTGCHEGVGEVGVCGATSDLEGQYSVHLALDPLPDGPPCSNRL